MISNFITESSSSKWSWINEPVGISKNDILSKTGLLEQINITADRSDYLWYSLRYTSLQVWKIFSLTDDSVLLDNTSIVFYRSVDLNDDPGSQTVLHIESLGHALHAFINGKLAGNYSLGFYGFYILKVSKSLCYWNSNEVEVDFKTC